MIHPRIFFFLLSVCLSAFSLHAQDSHDPLLGVWQPGSGKAHVRIDKVGQKYFGKIIWLREPKDPATGAPKLDKNNPDAAQKKKPLLGSFILKDFIAHSDKEWTDGTIYDPENGHSYKCVIKMKDKNTLDIRGYILIRAIGRTDIWKRVMNP